MAAKKPTNKMGEFSFDGKHNSQFAKLKASNMAAKKTSHCRRSLPKVLSHNFITDYRYNYICKPKKQQDGFVLFWWKTQLTVCLAKSLQHGRQRDFQEGGVHCDPRPKFCWTTFYRLRINRTQQTWWMRSVWIEVELACPWATHLQHGRQWDFLS